MKAYVVIELGDFGQIYRFRQMYLKNISYFTNMHDRNSEHTDDRKLKSIINLGYEWKYGE